jgi:Family of unknown function (DUF6600)/FecR protein
MHPLRTPITTLLSLLMAILAVNVSVRADDGEYTEDYEAEAGVARISLVRGDVSLKRNGDDSWESATLNTALVEGDTMATGRDAYLEIQIDSRNFVRLGGSSVLRLAALRDDGVALSLTEGVASVRLASFDKEHEYFEVDAPRTTLAAEQTGLYRLDVGSDGRLRFTVSDGGLARIYSENSGFTLRDGRSAALVYEGADAGDWEFSAVTGHDEWDDWVAQRERYLAGTLHYDTAYYDSSVWGAEDLDSYGTWVQSSDYGWLWRPRYSALSGYDDWSPYRYGSWSWCPPYGWTWVADEPWGWAPYHFGRWVYYDNYWAWSPRSAYYQQRSWWRPALVAFVVRDDRVCWYPLGFHQRDPRSRYFANRSRPGAWDRDFDDLQRHNRAYLLAVSGVSNRDFGNRRIRPRRVDENLARRVVTSEPSRSDLPVRRWTGTQAGGGVPERRGRPFPGASWSERPVGAATRTPGSPLDRDLHRTRIFNGREPRRGNAAGGGSNDSSTGAVLRPTRPLGQVDPRFERDRRRNNDGDQKRGLGDRDTRPTGDNNDASPREQRRRPPTAPTNGDVPQFTPRPNGRDRGTRDDSGDRRDARPPSGSNEADKRGLGDRDSRPTGDNNESTPRERRMQPPADPPRNGAPQVTPRLDGRDRGGRGDSGDRIDARRQGEQSERRTQVQPVERNPSPPVQRQEPQRRIERPTPRSEAPPANAPRPRFEAPPRSEPRRSESPPARQPEPRRVEAPPRSERPSAPAPRERRSGDGEQNRSPRVERKRDG